MVLLRRLPALLALALCACVAGPDYVKPADPAATDAWLTPSPAGEVDVTWWRRLDDPLLSELVQTAATRNLDVREAAATLLEARANRDAIAGGASAQVDAVASASRNQLSENGLLPLGRIPALERRFTLFDAGFDASWEIDFWGRNVRAVEAADARIGSAESMRRGAVMQVIAELVRSYVDLRAAQARLRSTRADAKARESVARLVGQRHRLGEAARFDALRADAQATSLRAQIPGIEAQAHAAAYRIALLTGQPPEALSRRLLDDAPLPAAPAAVSAGLRSELLRRRPDIRRAERDLAAATADVGTATADLFPRVSLLGSIGQQARSGGDLLDSGSTRFSFGPTLHWPLFDGGRIRALIRAADARAEGAAVRYERAVLGALSDSETALNRLDSARRTRADTEAARRQAAEALVLARQRYEAGEDDLIALLQAQSAYSAAERASIDARAHELQAVVALYKALGGGWERFEPHPS